MMSEEAFRFRSIVIGGVGNDGRSGSKRVTFGLGDLERERDFVGGNRTVGAASPDGGSAVGSDGVTVEFVDSFVTGAGPFIAGLASSGMSEVGLDSFSSTTDVFVVATFFSLDFCFVCLVFPGAGL